MVSSCIEMYNDKSYEERFLIPFPNDIIDTVSIQKMKLIRCCQISTVSRSIVRLRATNHRVNNQSINQCNAYWLCNNGNQWHFAKLTNIRPSPCHHPSTVSRDVSSLQHDCSSLWSILCNVVRYVKRVPFSRRIFYIQDTCCMTLSVCLSPYSDGRLYWASVSWFTCKMPSFILCEYLGFVHLSTTCSYMPISTASVVTWPQLTRSHRAHVCQAIDVINNGDSSFIL